MAPQAERLERLELRVSREHKKLIEAAAHARGESIVGYAVSQLVDVSAQVVQQHETRKLSDRDRELFLKLLDQTEPNNALKRAAKRYRQATGG